MPRFYFNFGADEQAWPFLIEDRTMQPAAKFPLGRPVATPGALEAMKASGQTPDFFLARHQSGDWGDVNEEDRRLNDEALLHGDRLLSVYRTLRGVRLYVITEADRSSTCLLLPEEH
jgi:hypothetical protein